MISNKSNNKTYLLAGGLATTLTLSALFLAGTNSYAASSDTTNLTLIVPSTCSLEVGTHDLTKTINPGTSD